MQKLKIVGAILVLFGCSVAQADPIQFEVTVGSNSLTWVLDQNPVPDFYDTDLFEIEDFIAYLNGTEMLVETIRFFSSNDGGGFNMDDVAGVIIDAIGPQMFGGTTAAPQFLLGTYSLSEANFPCRFCGGITEYSLTISAISVPEPGTLALLGIGLLGMGVARRRKKA